ncbi:uncharacterized protein [Palaemon carinicauda]|uniref:uncharacterized protein n=1 Tax=Palaemon carinicauda TaxID=392227 RepID=UPI0035B68F2C
MYRAVVLAVVAAVAGAQEAFFEKYGFTKTMASCFGEKTYYDFLARAGTAQRECQQLPVSNLYRLEFSVYSHLGHPLHFGGESQYVPFPSYHPVHPGHQGQPGHPTHPGQYHVPHSYQQFQYRKKRESSEVEDQKDGPFFDKYYLLDSVKKITASLSNYTCTLHKLGYIDEYLNLDLNNIVNNYKNLTIGEGFRKDLVDGLYYCRDLSYCLPLQNPRSPLPIHLQRLLMAMECEKETRTNACFKEDLRNNIDEFDLSLFPEDDDSEQRLNKLSAIITGIDSLNELQIL